MKHPLRNSLLCLAVFQVVACKNVVRPVSSIDSESDACRNSPESVQDATDCALDMRERYMAATVSIRKGTVVGDLSLITLAGTAGGVGIFEGSARISQGAGLLGGVIGAYKAYLSPAQASKIYAGAAFAMQCVADRGHNLAVAAKEHANAMATMQDVYERLEETQESELSEAFEKAYDACAQTPAMRLQGGYANAKKSAGAFTANAATSKVAAAGSNLPGEMMTAIREIDQKTFGLILANGGDVDAAKAKLAAAFKEIRATAESEKPMVAANAEVKDADPNPKVPPAPAVAGAAPPPPAATKTDKKNAEAATEAAVQATKTLHERMIDLLECTTR